jgi:hypothetical protein
MMRISTCGNLVVEAAARGVRVARFARPDLRPHLYDNADPARCPLFREVRDAALTDLAAGATLVLNLGLVGPFPAALYSCLLLVRRCLQARSARLMLCGLSEEHEELFRLLQGHRVFTVARTEAEAVRAAEASADTRGPAGRGRPRLPRLRKGGRTGAAPDAGAERTPPVFA